MSDAETKNKELFLNSRSNQNRSAVLVTGKLETLGSNFSHEIRFREAAGAYKCYYKNAHFREFKNVQN